MTKLACFLAGFILAIGLSGKATELLVEYGQCRFGKATDGTFYDSKMSPKLYLTPRCAEVGIAKKFAGSSWGWRIGFLQSGSVESRDSRAPMNDGLYFSEPCSDEHWMNCHSLFGGSGRMHGFSFAITKDKQLGGLWWTRGEVGVLFFEHFFNGYAKPQDYNGGAVVAAGAINGTAQKWEGGSLHQASKLPGMPVPRIGMSLGYGPLYISVRYNFAPGTFGLPGHDGSSVTDHSFTQITAGLAVKL